MQTRSALVASTLVLCTLAARAETAAQLILDARQNNGFDRSASYVVTIGDSCEPEITQAGAPIDQLELISGEAVIIELCTSAGEHYFQCAAPWADELFQNSAFWKAETATMYVEGDVFSACEVFPNADDICCAMHFIPITPGTYRATDTRCSGASSGGVMDVVVTGDASTTLEQSTDSAWTAPVLQDDNGVDASSGDWAGWEDPLFIELTLVENPSCGTASSGRKLSQSVDGSELQEGDADAGSTEDYMWVYTGGWTTASTPLIKGRDDVERDEGAADSTNAVMDSAQPEQGTAIISAVPARQHPIEMIVGEGYVLTFALLRPSSDHYLAAEDFWKSAIVRKIQDNIAEMKFQTYPKTMEVFDERASVEIYVVPTVVGDFEFKRTDDETVLEAQTDAGIFRVLSSKSELSDPSSYTTVPIYQGTC